MTTNTMGDEENLVQAVPNEKDHVVSTEEEKGVNRTPQPQSSSSSSHLLPAPPSLHSTDKNGNVGGEQLQQQQEQEALEQLQPQQQAHPGDNNDLVEAERPHHRPRSRKNHPLQRSHQHQTMSIAHLAVNDEIVVKRTTPFAESMRVSFLGMEDPVFSGAAFTLEERNGRNEDEEDDMMEAFRKSIKTTTSADTPMMRSRTSAPPKKPPRQQSVAKLGLGDDQPVDPSEAMGQAGGMILPVAESEHVMAATDRLPSETSFDPKSKATPDPEEFSHQVTPRRSSLDEFSLGDTTLGNDTATAMGDGASVASDPTADLQHGLDANVLKNCIQDMRSQLSGFTKKELSLSQLSIVAAQQQQQQQEESERAAAAAAREEAEIQATVEKYRQPLEDEIPHRSSPRKASSAKKSQRGRDENRTPSSMRRMQMSMEDELERLDSALKSLSGSLSKEASEEDDDDGWRRPIAAARRTVSLDTIPTKPALRKTRSEESHVILASLEGHNANDAAPKMIRRRDSGTLEMPSVDELNGKEKGVQEMPRRSEELLSLTSSKAPTPPARSSSPIPPTRMPESTAADSSASAHAHHEDVAPQIARRRLSRAMTSQNAINQRMSSANMTVQSSSSRLTETVIETDDEHLSLVSDDDTKDAMENRSDDSEIQRHTSLPDHVDKGRLSPRRVFPVREGHHMGRARSADGALEELMRRPASHKDAPIRAPPGREGHSLARAATGDKGVEELRQVASATRQISESALAARVQLPLQNFKEYSDEDDSNPKFQDDIAARIWAEEEGFIKGEENVDDFFDFPNVDKPKRAVRQRTTNTGSTGKQQTATQEGQSHKSNSPSHIGEVVVVTDENTADDKQVSNPPGSSSLGAASHSGDLYARRRTVNLTARSGQIDEDDVFAEHNVSDFFSHVDIARPKPAQRQVTRGKGIGQPQTVEEGKEGLYIRSTGDLPLDTGSRPGTTAFEEGKTSEMGHSIPQRRMTFAQNPPSPRHKVTSLPSPIPNRRPTFAQVGSGRRLSRSSRTSSRSEDTDDDRAESDDDEVRSTLETDSDEDGNLALGSDEDDDIVSQMAMESDDDNTPQPHSLDRLYLPSDDKQAAPVPPRRNSTRRGGRRPPVRRGEVGGDAGYTSHQHHDTLGHTGEPPGESPANSSRRKRIQDLRHHHRLSAMARQVKGTPADVHKQAIAQAGSQQAAELNDSGGDSSGEMNAFGLTEEISRELASLGDLADLVEEEGNDSSPELIEEVTRRLASLGDMADLEDEMKELQDAEAAAAAAEEAAEVAARLSVSKQREARSSSSKGGNTGAPALQNKRKAFLKMESQGSTMRSSASSFLLDSVSEGSLELSEAFSNSRAWSSSTADAVVPGLDPHLNKPGESSHVGKTGHTFAAGDQSASTFAPGYEGFDPSTTHAVESGHGIQSLDQDSRMMKSGHTFAPGYRLTDLDSRSMMKSGHTFAPGYQYQSTDMDSRSMMMKSGHTFAPGYQSTDLDSRSIMMKSGHTFAPGYQYQSTDLDSRSMMMKSGHTFAQQYQSVDSFAIEQPDLRMMKSGQTFAQQYQSVDSFAIDQLPGRHPVKSGQQAFAAGCGESGSTFADYEHSVGTFEQSTNTFATGFDHRFEQSTNTFAAQMDQSTNTFAAGFDQSVATFDQSTTTFADLNRSFEAGAKTHHQSNRMLDSGHGSASTLNDDIVSMASDHRHHYSMNQSGSTFPGGGLYGGHGSLSSWSQADDDKSEEMDHRGAGNAALLEAMLTDDED